MLLIVIVAYISPKPAVLPLGKLNRGLLYANVNHPNYVRLGWPQ